MNKTIIITGVSDGLGAAMGTELSKQNTVILLARNEEKLKQISNNSNAIYYVCDITKYDEVKKTVDDILKEQKSIDILINNAGAQVNGELENIAPEEIERVVDLNVKGLLNITKEIIPNMKENKKGLIININSQAGLYYKTERSVYHGSKWAMTGITGSLQAELSKYGIRVTGVYPGALEIGITLEGVKIPREKPSVSYSEVTNLIKYIINTPDDVLIPEIGIKHINN